MGEQSAQRSLEDFTGSFCSLAAGEGPDLGRGARRGGTAAVSAASVPEGPGDRHRAGPGTAVSGAVCGCDVGGTFKQRVL